MYVCSFGDQNYNIHVFQVLLTIKISINTLSQLVHTTHTHFIFPLHVQQFSINHNAPIVLHTLCNNYLF